MAKDIKSTDKDDILETFFLNLFFSGKVKSMPPKLKSDDGDNIVIRPMAYVDEAECAQYAKLKSFPVIPCNLCGSQENLQRKKVKKMLSEWDELYPGRKEVIFSALGNIAPSQMLDHALFDFKSLTSDTVIT